MVAQSYLHFLLAAAAVVHAAPLNINLGAYSPALVVGDGEIGFEGGQSVESIVNALQGAAVNGAAGAAGAANANGAAGAAGNAEAPGVVQAAAAPAPEPPILTEAATLPVPGATKELDPRVGEDAAKAKRDLSGFNRALTYAEAALEKGPKVQLGTGAKGSGVGIIVDNNKEAAVRPVTGAAE